MPKIKAEQPSRRGEGAFWARLDWLRQRFSYQQVLVIEVWY
jgi:hypothetical protein